MKFEELLKKQGLTDEQVTSITSAMNESKIYTTSVQNADVRYAKVKDDKKDLETQLGNANTTIADLKKLEIDNEDLKGKITTYEAEKSNYEKALETKDFEYALDKGLSEYKMKNPKLVRALLNTEKLQVVDGEVVGLKEQVESIKKENDYLFEKEIGGTGSFATGGNGGGNEPQTISFATELGKQKAESVQSKGIDSFIK